MENKQAIILLFVANTISGVAQGISMIAIPWYFTSIMSMGSTFGLLFTILTFISVFWSLYAGVLIDRFDRKRIFQIISLIGGFMLTGIALRGFQSGALTPLLAGAAFATTFLIYNIHFPNLYAFAQQITVPKDYGRITSFIEVQNQAASALSGAVAALLLGGVSAGSYVVFGLKFHIGFNITAWPLQKIFLLDGITYFLGLALVSMIRYYSVSERLVESGRVWQRLKTGLSFLKKHPMLFMFGSLSFSIFVTLIIASFFLIPVYISQHLEAGVGAYAGFEIFFAIGSIMAGLFIRTIFKRTKPAMAVILMTFIASAIFIISIFNYNLLFFFLLFMMLGLTNAGSRVMRATYIFNHIPNQYIGRTNSVFAQFHILFRLSFISLFSIPFFMNDGQVIYAFLILGLFNLTAALLLSLFFKRIVSENPPEAEKT